MQTLARSICLLQLVESRYAVEYHVLLLRRLGSLILTLGMFTAFPTIQSRHHPQRLVLSVAHVSKLSLALPFSRNHANASYVRGARVNFGKTFCQIDRASLRPAVDENWSYASTLSIFSPVSSACSSNSLRSTEQSVLGIVRILSAPLLSTSRSVTPTIVFVSDATSKVVVYV